MILAEEILKSINKLEFEQVFFLERDSKFDDLTLKISFFCRFFFDCCKSKRKNTNFTMRRSIVVLVLLLLCICYIETQPTTYIIGSQGLSCADACHAKKMNCNPNIETNNTDLVFEKLGVQCKNSNGNSTNKEWNGAEQPAYVSDLNDPDYGKCLGFMSVPSTVECGGAKASYSRLCKCQDPNSYSKVGAFGNGLSYSFVDNVERVILNWIVPVNHVGILTHLWITSYNEISSEVLIRYYIDDEQNASIAFYPPLACGVGFDDQKSPWGLEYFGKGAASGAWFNNFKIPFQRSIRITYQKTTPGSSNMFFMIVRGYPWSSSSSYPIATVGGIPLPSTARMRLYVTEKYLQPFEYIDLVNIPPNNSTTTGGSSSGLLFMHSLAVQSGNLQFLEGCYHAYTPYDVKFPGVLLSTGTEDYFDSAWYFNGGQFHFPVSGFTHAFQNNTFVTLSAYRFHRMDPIQFENGFRLQWRNGDLLNKAGQKCLYRKYSPPT